MSDFLEEHYMYFIEREIPDEGGSVCSVYDYIYIPRDDSLVEKIERILESYYDPNDCELALESCWEPLYKTKSAIMKQLRCIVRSNYVRQNLFEEAFMETNNLDVIEKYLEFTGSMDRRMKVSVIVTFD